MSLEQGDNLNEKIKVFIRIRPKTENSSNDNTKFIQVDHNILSLNRNIEPKNFLFDYIFQQESTQTQVFSLAAKEICDKALQGNDGTIIVYGQKNSGKTYTMMGSNSTKFSNTKNSNIEQKGLIQNCIEYITNYQIQNVKKKFLFFCSYFEIYEEKIIDLFKSDVNNQLNVVSIDNTINVDGLTKIIFYDANEGITLFNKGNKFRHTSNSPLNKESSKSHSIFSIYIEEYDDEMNNLFKSTINLVDLVGNDLKNKTKENNEKEDESITKSLMNLRLIVKTLGENSLNNTNKQVPFRDYKLTFLLKDSLISNCNTCIIANILSESSWENDTISTLNFAKNASFIKKKIANLPNSKESLYGQELKKFTDKFNEIKNENFYLLKLIKEYMKTNPNNCNLKNSLNGNININNPLNIHTNNRNLKNNNSQNNVTIESKISFIESEIEKGLSKLKEQKLLIDKLTYEELYLQGKYQKFELDILLKEKEINDIKKEIEDNHNNINLYEIQLNDFNKENIKMMDQINEHNNEIQKMKEQNNLHLSQLQLKKEESLKNLDENLNKLYNIQSHRDKINKNIQELTIHNNTLFTNKQILIKDTNDLCTTNEKWKINLENLKNNYNQYKEEQKELEIYINNLGNQINEYQMKIEAANDDFQNEKNKIDSLVNDFISNTKYYKTIKIQIDSNINNKINELNELEITYIVKQNNLDKIRSEYYRTEQEKNKLKNDINNLENKIKIMEEEVSYFQSSNQKNYCEEIPEEVEYNNNVINTSKEFSKNNNNNKQFKSEEKLKKIINSKNEFNSKTPNSKKVLILNKYKAINTEIKNQLLIAKKDCDKLQKYMIDVNGKPIKSEDEIIKNMEITLKNQDKCESIIKKNEDVMNDLILIIKTRLKSYDKDIENKPIHIQFEYFIDLLIEEGHRLDDSITDLLNKNKKMSELIYSLKREFVTKETQRKIDSLSFFEKSNNKSKNNNINTTHKKKNSAINSNIITNKNNAEIINGLSTNKRKFNHFMSIEYEQSLKKRENVNKNKNIQPEINFFSRNSPISKNNIQKINNAFTNNNRVSKDKEINILNNNMKRLTNSPLTINKRKNKKISKIESSNKNKSFFSK